MKKKIRIVIGFFVAIPVVIFAFSLQFLITCLKEYEGWLIDFKAWLEQ